jgi:SAM-dependent MidA family methyltransferase
MALSQGGAIAQTMDFQKILHRRDVLHRLIDPTGLGNFGVLIQGKNLPPEAIDPPLKGLQEPMGLGFV